MEAALQESENLYRSLFENMLNGLAYYKMIFEQGQPQDILYLSVNRAYEALTGLKNVVGKKVSEVIPALRESNPRMFEIFGRVALTGQPERFETYVEPLQKWFYISVFSPGKEYFATVFDDITERKRAEEALLKYEFIANTAKDCMTLINRNYMYEAANAVFCKAHGKTREEMVGTSLANIWGEDRFKNNIKGDLDRCFTGQTVESEDWFEFGEMGWGCYHVFYLPYFNEDGTVPYVAVVSHDITARKRDEESLRQSEERFRLVFEKAPIGIMHYDQTSTITDCNEKFVEIIGTHKEKFIGFNMIRQLQDEQMRKAVAASLDGQVGYYEGGYLSVTAGKLTTVRAIYQPIFSPEGVISGGITIFEDITERQRAESELKLKEKILDSASDSIFLYDPEGNFLYINEAAYITRWYKKEELLSLGAWALGTSEAAVYQDDVLKELWANGELIFESEHRRKDGSVMPVEIFARVLGVEKPGVDPQRGPGHYRAEAGGDPGEQGLEKLHQALQGTVMALANTVEIKDPYTAGHQRRVAQLSCAMAQELGWSADRVEGIKVLCFLHDMGKIAVPAEILNRPGKISPTEYGLIKVHPQVGYDILKDIDFPWPVAQGILQHHERLDGSGYPLGLSAGEITPEAKILAVADVVEAMASHRPYRPALGVDQALEEITRNKGRLYDPGVVDVCVHLFTEKDFRFD